MLQLAKNTEAGRQIVGAYKEGINAWHCGDVIYCFNRIVVFNLQQVQQWQNSFWHQ
jgi:hypothetical protein